MSLRIMLLELALRTPGANCLADVLDAVKQYEDFVDGKHEAEAPPAPGAAHRGYSDMQPHQQRVADEFAELNDKIIKLRDFLQTKVFAGLHRSEQRRLERQLLAMVNYSDILSERILAF